MKVYDMAKSAEQEAAADARSREYSAALKKALSGGNLQEASGVAADYGLNEDAIKLAQLDSQERSRQAETMYREAMLRKEIAKQEREDRKREAEEQAKIQPALDLQALIEQNSGLYSRFDKDFKSREDYAKQGAFAAGLSNLRRFNGDAEEHGARMEFDALKNTAYVEARKALLRQGHITEDDANKAASVALKAKNPYELEIALEELQNRVPGIRAAKQAGAAPAAGTAGAPQEAPPAPSGKYTIKRIC